MISLTFRDIDGFVTKQSSRGVNVRIDGWTIVFHHPDRRAYRHVKGRFDRKTGQWGFETRIDANKNGKWLVNPQLTRGK